MIDWSLAVNLDKLGEVVMGEIKFRDIVSGRDIDGNDFDEGVYEAMGGPPVQDEKDELLPDVCSVVVGGERCFCLLRDLRLKG